MTHCYRTILQVNWWNCCNWASYNRWLACLNFHEIKNITKILLAQLNKIYSGKTFIREYSLFLAQWHLLYIFIFFTMGFTMYIIVYLNEVLVFSSITFYLETERNIGLNIIKTRKLFRRAILMDLCGWKVAQMRKFQKYLQLKSRPWWKRERWHHCTMEIFIY